MSVRSLNLYWREIVSIIEGGLRPDPHRVSSFAEHLANRLEADGEDRLARRILRLIKEASTPAGSVFVGQVLPADVETQQSLVEQFFPTGHPHYPILQEFVTLELQRFAELNKRSGELAAAGLDPPSSLLLYGPPGCGKTMAAFAIACDLELPLQLVRLDSLIGSYLGNSAKNLRRVFDNALAKPCVLFLDEFDVIGKMRDDTYEVGEVKRLVGTLLQNLDRIQSEQVIIAATNHHHMLDAAIWRRFDVTLHLKKPGKAQLATIVSGHISSDRLSSFEVEAIATLANGLSGSDITNVVKRALQDEFLNPGEPFTKLITLGILASFSTYERSIRSIESKKDLILAVNSQSDGELSIRQIARLVVCSHTYTHEVIRALEKDCGNGQ